ncbi:UDP-glucose/GDP-mannose dehydrogenase family protein [Endozoicomonas sp. SCSIO W0465]|uniref:UDP-glucose dehydrogenase family protein n=1 Tax=Endozoicomonas sp. SCSIO W0465 TaxID=2918516 RepID=UPI0020762322|nr:UDP-glucose/GDP-mannose dehydrogenase family protein [Endozoicomonas sp. SCSIO W0465]USE37497.1 UDP-glucose/GDP-mannose dehydrogenase family protein [Endozoicomonas sp. SCSIO W0465]
MKVTVFGIGYVGLVQAAVLAEVGHDVVCVDIDQNKVDNLKRGIIPIYEPGLESIVKENSEAGRLRFTTDAAEGIAHGTLQFIAVGTPPDEDGSADLQYVLAVASTIAEHMEDRKIIVNKSTVPVGTADKVAAKVAEVLQKRGVQLEFSVASNPEFLKEGAAVNDCMRPDRIVVGTDSADLKNNHVIDTMKELYAPFNRNHDRMIFMDVRSAELTKYAANCMLATKISFMNEMAGLADRLGADIEMVRQGIGSDPRIGFHFIYPGCGYGGSCFPKDVQALKRTAEDIDFEPLILRAVEERNAQQKNVLFTKLSTHFNGQLAGRTIALWGLAFKPNTDDMRDAPSRVLMESLWQAGATVQAYDPEAMEEAQRIYGLRDDLTLSGTPQAAIKGADALVICTEWRQFRAPDFDQLRELLKEPVIFDGRNMYEPERMRQKGFTYYAIGR